MTQTFPSQGVEFIADWEDLRLVAYQDIGGAWTLGYGHTENVQEGDGTTERAAMFQLAIDCDKVCKLVLSFTKVALTDNQLIALTSFTFNLGARNFLDSTLLKMVNMNKFREAATEFKRWNHVNGKVVEGLSRRRLAESELFLRGLDFSDSSFYGGTNVL